MKEYVILVDEKDQAIGQAEKMQAHQEGKLHRAFSVFLLRIRHAQWEILLQKRASTKYHCGELWTNSCCGHPRPVETIIAASQRRLTEEMNIAVPLTAVGHFQYEAHFSNGLTEKEYDYVLIGKYEADTCTPNPEEVSQTQWITIENLKQQIAATPQQYTPWLPLALALLEKQDLDSSLRWNDA